MYRIAFLRNFKVTNKQNRPCLKYVILIYNCLSLGVLNIVHDIKILNIARINCRSSTTWIQEEKSTQLYGKQYFPLTSLCSIVFFSSLSSIWPGISRYIIGRHESNILIPLYASDGLLINLISWKLISFTTCILDLTT